MNSEDPRITDEELEAEGQRLQDASFVGALYDPSRWYARARALFGASRAIAERSRTLIVPLEKSELGRVYRMLAGMALEALLKALLVAQVAEDQRTTVFPDRLKTHNLRVLCDRLKINLTDDQRMCIENLTDHIVWTGRYPVPLEPAKFGSYTHWQEEELVEALFRRLSKPLDLAS